MATQYIQLVIMTCFSSFVHMTVLTASLIGAKLPTYLYIYLYIRFLSYSVCHACHLYLTSISETDHIWQRNWWVFRLPFFFFPLIYRRNYYNYSVQERKESRTQAQLPVWWFSKYVKLIKDDAKKKRPNFKHRLDYCSNLSFNIPFQEYATAIVMIRVEVC